MRVILLGVGGFGGVWVRALAASTETQVVGLVDVNPSALEKACEVLQLNSDVCFSDLEKACSAVNAEALICVTPPALHRPHVLTGLRAGLHVLCEKPMAESREDCIAMVEAAEQSGKLFGVSQNYRYGEPMQVMRRALDDGLIGEVGQVRIDFFRGVNFGGGFRHRMDFPVLVDMSIHHFDLLRFLSKKNALSAVAQAWNPPWSNYDGDASCSVVFEMQGGATALYNASWAAQGAFSDWNGNWYIEGTRGSLCYEHGKVRLLEVEPHYSVRRERSLPVPPQSQGSQNLILSEFVAAVKTGRPFGTSGADNIHSVNMVFAAVEAARSGRRIEI